MSCDQSASACIDACPEGSTVQLPVSVHTPSLSTLTKTTNRGWRIVSNTFQDILNVHRCSYLREAIHITEAYAVEAAWIHF